MVRLSNLTIKNFKFYINESIDINSQNFLIYGENGVGKSSLFGSLYYLFYGYFDDSLIENIQEFKNRDSDEDIELLVKFSNDEYIRIDENSINSDVSILEKQNIYLLDYKFLDTFFDKNDFFLTLEAIQNRFIIFDNIFEDISGINQALEVASIQSLNPRRVELNSKLNRLVSDIENRTNQIIVELKENFTIKLDLEEAQLEEGALRSKLHNPKIYIEIDGIRDFKSHFNESKIKILSLALVFAMIKLNQERNPSTNSDNLKLLALDDFLSSLDMGNRLYIMEYIFNHFKDYQKIILTHNLSFFSIIKRTITYHGEDDKWNKTNLYRSLKENNFYIPKLINEKKYLEEAEESFKDDKFEECGNLLRKEIERIISKSNILFEIGRKENLESAIKNLINEKRYFINPNKILTKVEKEFNGFKDEYMYKSNIPDNRKLEILVQELNYIFQNPQINSQKLNIILNSINFYKDTILNKASHHSEEEHYQKEYKEAIKDVQKLKDIFNDFNKIQN